MIRKTITKFTAVALALGALTSVALAEPVELTEAQMDQVSAGAFRMQYDRFGNFQLHSSWGRAFTYDATTGLYWENGEAWHPYGYYNGTAYGSGMVYADDGHAYGYLVMVNPDGSCCSGNPIWENGSHRGRYGD